MLKISLTHNLDAVAKRIEQRVRRIPDAAALALTNTAHAVRQAEYDHMRKVFDRPVPFTLNSLYVKAASRGNLTAVVWLKPGANNYLHAQIFGGTRKLKRFEKALQHARGGLGQPMPANMFAVPGTGARLDAYGNISRGQIVQILSAFQSAQDVAGFAANRTARSVKRRGKKLAQFFIGRPGRGKLPLGIWQRFQFAHGSAIKPVLIFVRSTRYKKLFQFYEVGEETARKTFGGYFEAALRGL
jgi:hypothetical protein